MRLTSSTVMVAVAFVMLSAPSGPSHAGTDPYLGEIMWTAAAHCPRDWTDADGQMLEIDQHQVLFSLLGTAYGGDGRRTFGLPDLRGRVAIHTGQGAGLSSYPLGAKGGAERATLSTAELPAHSHTLRAGASATTNDPSGSIPGRGKQQIYDALDKTDGKMASNAVMSSGGGQAHENRPPYLTMRACIAMVGTFPARN